ncbi:MAG: phage baseplate assembly protein V [Vampirovibrio sp.]
MFNNYALAETQRQQSQSTTAGEVVAIDATTARVKVDDGELVTDWIPWVAPTWGAVKVWSVPSIGTHCVLIVPDHNWEHAFALGGVVGASGGTANQHHIDFGDGTKLMYNTSTKALTVDSTGSLAVTCPTMSLTGDVSLTGDLTVTGAVVGTSVADATGTMSTMRSQYNSHNHGGAGATPPMS